ncbi:MAG TPA: DEAD/DEAH box helicase family protein, partial [Nitrososphaeraceae archaeon]|nr:DEAD/DEAH box helicase family protein [Nitrososphaeraceae archaeon]
MGLKDLAWLSHYDSRINNVTTEFFIPALSSSTVYRRVAGLFSSTSFALCARGAKEFISNSGLMQLIISPILTKQEIEAMREVEDPTEVITNSLSIQLDNIQDEFEKNHINALKFLLKKGFLEIRVEIPKSEDGLPLDVDSIMKSTMLSEKRGIFQDRDGHVISFRGPVNESAHNWEKGTYQITVDTDWVEGQRQHVIDDIKIFDEKWTDPDVIPLPRSIEERLIKTAPQIDDINLEKFDYPQWARIPNNGALWPHQIRAVNAWIQNDYYGIFTMATGSGKTIAALTAVNIAPKEKLVIVVAYGKVLVRQWEREVKNYDGTSDTIVCDSSTNWKTILPGKLIPFLKDSNSGRVNHRLYIITTPQT